MNEYCKNAMTMNDKYMRALDEKSKENEPIEIFVNKVATKAKIPLSKMPQPFFFTKFIITLLFVTY